MILISKSMGNILVDKYIKIYYYIFLYLMFKKDVFIMCGAVEDIFLGLEV